MNVVCNLLSIFIIIDPIVNQIITTNSSTLTEGSPLLQALRIVEMFIAIIYLTLSKRKLINERTFPILILIGASLLVSSVLNGIELLDLTNYGHIAYWMIFWVVAERVARNPYLKIRLESALIIESLIILFSIYFCYFFPPNTNTIYSDTGVKASVGWFTYGKTIGVTACLGFFLINKRFNTNKRWFKYLIFVITMIGVLMTQARAAILSFFIAVTWFAYKHLKINKISNWKLMLFFSVCLGFIIYLGIGNFTISESGIFSLNRWKELGMANGGSGRKTFWLLDLNTYINSDLPQLLFGMGYKGMCEANLKSYGLFIHTHNDLLDALMIGGILMAFGLLWLWYFLIKNSLSKLLEPQARIYALALIILLITNGLTTGFLFSASDLLAILAAWSCVTSGGVTDLTNNCETLVSNKTYLEPTT